MMVQTEAEHILVGREKRKNKGDGLMLAASRLGSIGTTTPQAGDGEIANRWQIYGGTI